MDRVEKKRYGVQRIVDKTGWICERCYLNDEPHGLSITYAHNSVFVRFYQYGQKLARFVFSPDTWVEEYRQVWETDPIQRKAKWINTNSFQVDQSTNKRWLHDLHPVDFKPGTKSRIFQRKTHEAKLSIKNEVTKMLESEPGCN